VYDLKFLSDGKGCTMLRDDKERQRIKVTMLGGFSVSFEGKQMALERNGTTKAMQLLQILLIRGTEGVTSQELQQFLYARDEVSNPVNNLNVTIFRLRKFLADSVLPEGNYIQFAESRYRWVSEVKTEVDAVEFLDAAKIAENEDDPSERLPLLRNACHLYSGPFLPMLESMDWVIIYASKCRDAYFEVLSSTCEMMDELRSYDEELELCSKAAVYYPYEEKWQLKRMDCLLALRRYTDAMKVYDEVSSLYFEDLGIRPSEEMLSRFRTMSSEAQEIYSPLEEIKKMLQEKERPAGAYYCSYPSFIDCYRMVVRTIERSGQSVYLMLCTLSNRSDEPLEAGTQLRMAAACVRDAARASLRRGDFFTRFSPNQFLMLLQGTNRENCMVAAERITKYFSEKSEGVRGVRLQFSEISAADLTMNADEQAKEIPAGQLHKTAW